MGRCALTLFLCAAAAALAHAAPAATDDCMLCAIGEGSHELQLDAAVGMFKGMAAGKSCADVRFANTLERCPQCNMRGAEGQWQMVQDGEQYECDRWTAHCNKLMASTPKPYDITNVNEGELDEDCVRCVHNEGTKSHQLLEARNMFGLLGHPDEDCATARYDSDMMRCPGCETADMGTLANVLNGAKYECNRWIGYCGKLV